MMSMRAVQAEGTCVLYGYGVSTWDGCDMQPSMRMYATVRTLWTWVRVWRFVRGVHHMAPWLLMQCGCCLPASKPLCALQLQQ